MTPPALLPSFYLAMPAVAGSWPTAVQMIHWRPAHPGSPDAVGALIAENAETARCWARARLWHRPTEQRPWVVRIEIGCVDKRPWVHEKSFVNLPAAVRHYLQHRDAATVRLLRELDGN